VVGQRKLYTTYFSWPFTFPGQKFSHVEHHNDEILISMMNKWKDRIGRKIKSSLMNSFDDLNGGYK